MAIEQFSIDVLFSYRLNNILFDIRMHNYVVIFGLSCHALKNGCQVDSNWISCGCRVDGEWMSSGWGVDINIDTGLFCSCYMEQGRVKSDSLLFHITRPKQPRAK